MASIKSRGGPFLLMKRTAAFFLLKIQNVSTYRRVARRFRPDIDIQVADAVDIKKVHAWLNPHAPEQNISINPNVTNWVAKRGAKVIGFVQLVRRPKRDQPYAGYWLFSLTVMLLYHGMGIGEALCQAVIDKAREEEASELSLLVRKDRLPAVELYRKLGFEVKVIPAMEDKLEEENILHGYRRVVMSKPLQGIPGKLSYDQSFIQ
jgi:ribosomal protein S18 acetylase RimI-like enzyme